MKKTRGSVDIYLSIYLFILWSLQFSNLILFYEPYEFFWLLTSDHKHFPWKAEIGKGR